MVGGFNGWFRGLWVCMAICMACAMARANSLEDFAGGVKPVDVDRYTSYSLALERIEAQMKAEKNPDRKLMLRDESYRLNDVLNDMNVDSTTLAVKTLYAEWQKTSDTQKRAAIEPELIRLAGRYHLNDVIQDVKYSDRLKVAEIKLTSATMTAIEPVFEFKGFSPEGQNRFNRTWATRRINKDRFEVWSATEGWLFDGTGKLLNHAKVPRRDGSALSWFGAFLPDGRWATSEIWNYDMQFHLYAADGKFIKTIENADIVKTSGQPFSPGDSLNHGRIDWARSDADGKGWVMQISQYSAKFFWVNADGTPKHITRAEAYKLVYPRALGSRGRMPVIPSDDASRWMLVEQGGHGPMVDTPSYNVLLKLNENADPAPPQPGEYSLSIYGGTMNAGFWPASHEAYIVKQRDTWCFDEKGQLAAWVRACRFADAADGKGMLFETQSPDFWVLTIGPDHKVSNARKFFWADDKTEARIEQLYDDLNLGVFIKNGTLTLARIK